MSALNPIFTIANQISEALLLHKGEAIIDRLLAARTTGPEVDSAMANVLAAARTGNLDELRAAARKLGEATYLPSVGTQAYYILKGAGPDPQSKLHELKRALHRAHLTGMQKAYLRLERRRNELGRALKEIYLNEMRYGQIDRKSRRHISSRLRSLGLRGGQFGLPGIKRYVRAPLVDETFWLTVGHLEGVTIANPVQVAKGYPHELSGGMLQRVMIAMALCSDPELLIADEPTTALDVTIQAQILDLMKDLKTRVGTSILLITHDLGVIAEVSDRVCVMYAGNVVENAPVRALFRHALHPYSQGLIASIPRVDDPSKKLESIPGSVPNLISPPSGCRFHPRCPHAMPICKESRPPMTLEGEGHTVACFLYHGPPAPESD
jgi:oligopeptide/dipeptide ABC transporter ATP-binding protein